MRVFIGRYRSHSSRLPLLLGAAIILNLEIAPPSRATQKADASQTYLGDLPHRAASGDKEAELELGKRYEYGDGAPIDLVRAAELYSAAGADTYETRMIFVPIKSGAVEAVPVTSGPKVLGIREAQQRLSELCMVKIVRSRACAHRKPVSNGASIYQPLRNRPQKERYYRCDDNPFIFEGLLFDGLSKRIILRLPKEFSEKSYYFINKNSVLTFTNVSAKDQSRMEDFFAGKGTPYYFMRLTGTACSQRNGTNLFPLNISKVYFGSVRI